MWQAPNQKTRSFGSSKKRNKDRLDRHFHLKRVQAELKILGVLDAPPKLFEARVLLNDLSPKGLGLFTIEPLVIGQEVALTLEEPKRFYIKARVVWCNEYDSDTHVLTDHAFSYRVGLEFSYETQEEEKGVIDYCEELAQKYLYGRAA